MTSIAGKLAHCNYFVAEILECAAQAFGEIRQS
jgi:hypothetical protein